MKKYKRDNMSGALIVSAENIQEYTKNKNIHNRIEYLEKQVSELKEKVIILQEINKNA